MNCKFCGLPLTGAYGKREFCRNAHRQAYYRHQMQSQHQQTTAQAQETNKLQAKIEDLEDSVTQLKSTIRQLEIDADLEHRYLVDTQARSFIAFLRSQPPTPFVTKLLNDPRILLEKRAGRYHYEIRLVTNQNYSEDDLNQFKDLWKLLLLTLDRKKRPFSTIEKQPLEEKSAEGKNEHTFIINLVAFKEL